MFTGIITDVGRIEAIERRGDMRVVIASSFDAAALPTGASIACDGVCLTVIRAASGVFEVEVSAETQSCTTAGGWTVGGTLNLERSLYLGDDLGGHLVFGHVDGVAEVLSVTPDGDSRRWRFRAPRTLAKFLAPKGSVALNGVSLTVNEVDSAEFGVNLIPHTQTHTTFSALGPGDKVNIEIDMLARYVARQLAAE